MRDSSVGGCSEVTLASLCYVCSTHYSQRLEVVLTAQAMEMIITAANECGSDFGSVVLADLQSLYPKYPFSQPSHSSQQSHGV